MKTLTFTKYSVSMLLFFLIATSCTSSNGKMKDSSIELINEPQMPGEESFVCLAYMNNHQEQVMNQ